MLNTNKILNSNDIARVKTLASYFKAGEIQDEADAVEVFAAVKKALENVKAKHADLVGLNQAKQLIDEDLKSLKIDANFLVKVYSDLESAITSEHARQAQTLQEMQAMLDQIKF